MRKDENTDAKVQKGELLSPKDLGIIAIYTRPEYDQYANAMAVHEPSSLLHTVAELFEAELRALEAKQGPLTKKPLPARA